jgi:hypothetical protein
VSRTPSVGDARPLEWVDTDPFGSLGRDEEVYKAPEFLRSPIDGPRTETAEICPTPGSGDDTALLPTSVGYGSHLDHVSAVGNDDDEGGVVQLARAAMLEERAERLEESLADPQEVLPGAKGIHTSSTDAATTRRSSADPAVGPAPQRSLDWREW